MTDKECELATRFWDQSICFFGLNEGIHSYEQLGGAIALLLAAFALIANLIVTVKAVLLVRWMNPAGRRGNLLPALFTVVEILLRHPQSPLQRSWNLYIRMRMRVEHEIFDPRPEWQWPPEGRDVPGGRFALLGSFWPFVKARWAWHLRMAGIANKQCIDIETAGDLNDELDALSRYFNVIRALPFAGDPVPSFLCQVRILRGFLAPLHLLTGLLVEYNEKWDPIIDEFENQTRGWRDVPLIDPADGSGRLTSRDFRQLQSFIYHCWLLWGPSIPICAPSCGNWTGSYLSLQYGYGDENNSIELVGDRVMLAKQIHRITHEMQRPGIMALPMVVTGILQYSSTASIEPTKLPLAVKTSWKGGQDARPVLFFSEGMSGNALTGERAAGEQITGIIEFDNRIIQPGSPRSHYYSAYLWIMFVVLRWDETGKSWVPLTPDEMANPMRTREPWNGTIPFFEHGNIADAESCGFAKQVLADKVIGAMVQFIQPWDPGAFPLRFAYSAAIDDSHCGHQLLFPSLAGGKTVRKRLEDRLEAAPAGGLIKRLLDEEIFLFDHYRKDDHHHPHSACSLPFDLDQYYATMSDTPAAPVAAEAVPAPYEDDLSG